MIVFMLKDDRVKAFCLALNQHLDGSEASAWQHLSILLIGTVSVLSVAAFVLNKRELTLSASGD